MIFTVFLVNIYSLSLFFCWIFQDGRFSPATPEQFFADLGRKMQEVISSDIELFYSTLFSICSFFFVFVLRVPYLAYVFVLNQHSQYWFTCLESWKVDLKYPVVSDWSSPGSHISSCSLQQTSSRISLPLTLKELGLPYQKYLKWPFCFGSVCSCFADFFTFWETAFDSQE